MLLNTFEPGKFAFSSESVDLYNLEEKESKGDFAKSKKWGIIGVPFDSTCSYHHGSRYGPTIIREASLGFEQYNCDFEKPLDGEFYDCGDLNVVHGNCKKTCDILEDSVNELIEANIKPILIGGEHSVTIGSVKALAEEKDSHATIMRRFHDLNPKELIQIGIRSFSVEEKEFVESQDNITSFLAKDLFDDFDVLLEKLDSIEGKVYVSIDMDAIDPAFAPSVGNPTPNGLHPVDVENIFEVLGNNEKIDVIGFDIVEVASDRLGDITAVLAAKIVYDFLTLFA